MTCAGCFSVGPRRNGGFCFQCDGNAAAVRTDDVKQLLWCLAFSLLCGGLLGIKLAELLK